jgi:anthranilate synthase component 1
LEKIRSTVFSLRDSFDLKSDCRLHDKASTMQVVADNFPAGTLRKINTEQCTIEHTKNEPKFFMSNWFMDFEGNFHAIMIGLFVSKSRIASASRCWNSVLMLSKWKYNKLRALNKALDVAETI